MAERIEDRVLIRQLEKVEAEVQTCNQEVEQWESDVEQAAVRIEKKEE